MKRYCITFYQCTSIEVEADDEEAAFKIAAKEFDRTMRRPIAHTEYDDVDIQEVSPPVDD